MSESRKPGLNRASPGERKRGWLPIPAFSHREPPFCVAQEDYLFFAAFFLVAFFAVFLAPPFFAVAIVLLLLSLDFTVHTRYCSVATLVHYRK